LPGARIVGELAIELRIGAERIEEGGLVVGAAAHPAIGNAGPGRDRIALRDDVLRRAGRLEELVGVASRSRVGRRGEHVLGRCVVQGVIELSHRGGRVAERRVRRHVRNPLAIDVDLAPVAQGLQEFGAGERAVLAFDDGFGVLRHGVIRCLSREAGRASNTGPVPGRRIVRRPTRGARDEDLTGAARSHKAARDQRQILLRPLSRAGLRPIALAARYPIGPMEPVRNQGACFIISSRVI
jgi:hypothetical protein